MTLSARKEIDMSRQAKLMTGLLAITFFAGLADGMKPNYIICLVFQTGCLISIIWMNRKRK